MAKTFARALEQCLDCEPTTPSFVAELCAFAQDASQTRLFLPIKSQLALPLGFGEELCALLARPAEFVVELKLDGERFQIHFCAETGRLKLYARLKLNAQQRFAFA